MVFSVCLMTFCKVLKITWREQREKENLPDGYLLVECFSPFLPPTAQKPSLYAEDRFALEDTTHELKSDTFCLRCVKDV